AVDAWDMLITVIANLMDDAGGRTWDDRLQAGIEATYGLQVSEEKVVAELERFASYMADSGRGDLERMIKRINRPSFVAFLRRILGSALFDRLNSAFRQDVAILVVALRKAARAVMPFAVAFEDLADSLTPGQ